MSRDRTIAATCILLAAAAGWSQAPLPDSPQMEQRIDAMLSKLTLEEKIPLLGGEDPASANTPLRQQFILEPKEGIEER